MTITEINREQEKMIAAYDILNDLYGFLDDTFISYFISLEALRVWRPHLEKYEFDYKEILKKEGLSVPDIDERIAQQDHILSEGEFKVQTKTKRLKNILTPGRFENIQAKNAIKIVYDEWESTYRPELEKLLGDKVQGDIWGDLRYIRHSISHRSSKGVDELKRAKIIKDFRPNQEVVLTSEIMEKIRHALEEWYTEFLVSNFSPMSMLK